MLHHLSFWVPDLERARAPWSWLLGRLGYTLDETFDRVLVFRHASGPALVLEQSSDMVPGMLHSRLRPGLNHVAFELEGSAGLEDFVGEAAEHGWSILPIDGHPIAGGADVVYLEDLDGFEVELVAPAAT
jgi:catechol 2,3-dioxygenase-like lactoylglutathione lyase family enzyme